MTAAATVEFSPGEVIAIDSAPIIYYLEAHPRYARRFAPLFEAADEGRVDIVISAITVAEVLSGPLAQADELLAARYREALSATPHWTVYPVDVELAEDAARLRARYKLRLPDALQVATALKARADRFVTHDRRVKRVKELKVVGIA